MKIRSLGLRLGALAALTTCVLLTLAGLVFHILFQNNVENYAKEELNTHFEQLLSGLSITADGKINNTATLSDPRFEQPQGGLYWQISLDGSEPARSRSLWDDTLPSNSQGVADEENLRSIEGGSETGPLLVLAKTIRIDDEARRERTLHISVATDKLRIRNAVNSFGRDMTYGLGILCVALVVASFGMIQAGLRPLRSLRSQVENLRKGVAEKIGGNHPSEVAPLVDEVNSLVTAREKQLERARQRAGNLAHGLKTPLTVLAAIAGELESSGDPSTAKEIRLGIGQMRDLVDRELARGRMSASNASHRVALLPKAQGIIETLKRAPGAEKLEWRIAIGATTHVAMDAVDLLELLGNLLDNARKHARNVVSISHDGTWLVVEDDGAGVAEEKLSNIAKRGVKLDSLAPGSGLGLSIVSDLAEVYDFELAFSRSALGGLRATLQLPAMQ